MGQLVAGVDFGSDSVRVVFVEAETGKTVASSSCIYPRWQQKMYCNESENIFRQHPSDYTESFTQAFQSASKQLTDEQRSCICAIGVDTTGSTPCPVNQEGVALACLPEFAENPNAMFYLWKDHSAQEEAKEVNEMLQNGDIDYTKFQGEYSSEWYWAKILHAARTDALVREQAYTWVEHCDWMIGILTGKSRPEELYHNASSAGHKALWHSEFSGLPSQECLSRIDPYLAEVARNYGSAPKNADTAVGKLCDEWSEILGLQQNVVISGGSLDAHAGAVGAGIAPGTMVKVIGTSAVDMQVIPMDCEIKGDLRPFCGLAENSILPGYIGVEAGQAAFGDIFAWFQNLLCWPLQHLEFTGIEPIKVEQIRQQIQDNLLAAWGKELEKQMPQCDVISLDWFNGRRYPYLNESCKGAITGLTLGSTATEIYASLVKSAIFGSKRMFEGYTSNGLNIERIVVVGGIAKKAPYIIQLLADQLQRPIMICRENEVCARGAAIFAAVASGIYATIEEAQSVFCERFVVDFAPKKDETIDAEYKKYISIADALEPLTSSDILHYPNCLF